MKTILYHARNAVVLGLVLWAFGEFIKACEREADMRQEVRETR